MYSHAEANEGSRLRLRLIAGLVLLGLVVLFVTLWPVLSPYGRDDIDLAAATQGPSLVHPFGTDQLGRDLSTRVAAAGRTSLAVAAGVALLSTVIALIIGALAGYFGGAADHILMRITDLFLTLPPILVLLIAGALYGGGAPLPILLVLAAFAWMQPARALRAQIAATARSPFVEQARYMGATAAGIIRRHLFPATIGVAVAAFTLTFSAALLAETTLSFLGFGIQPPAPTLGGMLRETLTAAISAPWLALFPGAMIMFSSLLAGSLGETVQTYLDPLAREQATKPALKILGGKSRRRSPVEPLFCEIHPDEDYLARISGLTVTSDSKSIIDGATVAILPGETMALVGRSGSGKTTLALAMLGLLPPGLSSDGEISFEGRLFSGEGQFVRGRSAGMILQDPHAAFVPVKSIAWHFEQAHRFHFKDTPPASQSRAAQWLTRAGISDPGAYLGRFPGAVSGGELQRIAIALTLSLEPRLLIADEPTASLDYLKGEAILDLIAEIQDERGFAVLLITHDLGTVLDRADRVVVLGGGRLSHPIDLRPEGTREIRHPEITSLIDEIAAHGASDLVEAARRLRLTEKALHE